MKRKGLSSVVCGLLVAYATLAAGCTEFITDSARTNIAGFFTTVLTEAVNTSILPRD